MIDVGSIGLNVTGGADGDGAAMLMVSGSTSIGSSSSGAAS